MSITLVRHTRPDVEVGVCYGLTDLPLAVSFDEEAAQLIPALPKAENLVTSPLLRCRRLAERIGSELGIEPVVDQRLQEMSFGHWEGMSWNDISRAELDEWAKDFLYARPHGGESVHMLRVRVMNALADYQRAGSDHIVVTHAGVIRAALARGDTADDYDSRIAFGQVIELTA